ncbi:MAG: hypothetical protein JXB42_11220 [Deltaproteobacteria bacterium]|nr:hypothetical protein [Deltaproteobacteria bacterium]
MTIVHRGGAVEIKTDDGKGLLLTDVEYQNGLRRFSSVERNKAWAAQNRKYLEGRCDIEQPLSSEP